MIHNQINSCFEEKLDFLVAPNYRDIAMSYFLIILSGLKFCGIAAAQLNLCSVNFYFLECCFSNFLTGRAI